MIISRTPFRLSFVGGGTDLPEFYKHEEGVVVSTAIDKFMHITINRRFDKSYRLSYSETEICAQISEIKHPIFKAVLENYSENATGLEIISMADIPSGTGLGSSSSFTVGLIHALKSYLGTFQKSEDLAAAACKIEIDILKEPIGKQDQYAAAFGGLRTIHFFPDGTVKVNPLDCSPEKVRELESHIMMFYTGIQRSASHIFEEQQRNTPAKLKDLREARDLALQLKVILEKDRPMKEFGKVLNQGWQIKRTMASGVTTADIDAWYAAGIKAGAYGGKILGAGGGGFLMFICPPEKQPTLKQVLSGLRHVPMKFETWGSKIIFVGEG
jgi:D-glycero-alpha-D-manno-heptose-7-phosphate kinase